MSLEFVVTEIFASIQGESTFAGLPCLFIRLTGCPLRCRWCDTVYGFKGGQSMTLDQIVKKVTDSEINLVEITGGEPLAQAGVSDLITELQNIGCHVLLETGGSESIASVPKATEIIMDIKCPGSGMDDKNHIENLSLLKPTDQIKFVIADEKDFDWAVGFIEEYSLENKYTLLMSPAWGLCEPEQLVNWMLRSKIKCRLNLQLHKYVWGPLVKGV